MAKAMKAERRGRLVPMEEDEGRDGVEREDDASAPVNTASIAPLSLSIARVNKEGKFKDILTFFFPVLTVFFFSPKKKKISPKPTMVSTLFYQLFSIFFKTLALTLFSFFF